MAVNVSIDTASKRDAEVIAADLPGNPEPRSWRGYGIVRLRVKTDADARRLVPMVGECVERHELPWARVRIGDDETMFRSRRRRAS